MLQVELPAIEAPAAGVVDASGNAVLPADSFVYWAIISEVQIEIGGTEVDTLYPEWMFFWEEMTQRPGARLGEQIGKFSYSSDVEEDMIEFASKARTLYVPLPFWFNKYFMEQGLSVPLIALTYHEIKVKVTFRPLSECCCVLYKDTDASAFLHGDFYGLDTNSTPVSTASGSTLVASDMDARLLISYVYLDVEERQAFAAVEHEYLITTTQRQQHAITSAGTASQQIKLFFNHPSNCLAWFIRPTDWINSRRRYSVGHMDSFDFSLFSDDLSKGVWGDVVDPVKCASLSLNGHSRFPDNMPGMFFRQAQPIMKWPNVSSGYMYVFSFSAQGGVWQPTATLNMSRIDHVLLELKYNTDIPTSDVFIFAEAYNLLVVKDGMAGVKYSN